MLEVTQVLIYAAQSGALLQCTRTMHSYNALLQCMTTTHDYSMSQLCYSSVTAKGGEA